MLEVDSWRLGALPELKAFADGAAKAYPKGVFKLRATPFSPPTLVLKGAPGSDVPPLRRRVDGWKTDALNDFLAAKLATGGVQAAAAA